MNYSNGRNKKCLQDRRRTYDVKLMGVRVIIVVSVGKQEVSNIMRVCLKP